MRRFTKSTTRQGRSRTFFFYHTVAKRAPFVGDDEDAEAVSRMRAQIKAAGNKRRGGEGLVVPTSSIPLADTRDAQKIRHIDVQERGDRKIPDRG